MRNNKLIVITANTSWYVFNFRSSTILKFVDNGYDVLVLVGDLSHASKISNLGAVVKKVSINPHSVNPFFDIVTFFNYLYFYLRFSPFVVFNFTPKPNIYSAFAGFISGCLVVNNISGFGRAITSRSFVGFLLKFLYKASSRICSLVFVQNMHDYYICLNEFKVDLNRLDILPGSGVDLNKFSYRKLSSNRVAFGFFSRLIPSKGVALLAEAVCKIRAEYDFDFDVYFAGPLDSSSSIDINTLKDWQDRCQIQYLGVLDDVLPHLYKIHCLVLPSFYPEGTPKILIEAASTGRPIITTDHPGCRDLFVGDNGYLIIKNDLDDLINKMVQFLSLNPSQRQLMGVSSRKLACSKYDESIVLTKYMNFVSNFDH